MACSCPTWILDENGLYFTSDRVNAFMTKTFDYLLDEAIDPVLGDPTDGYRLIQKFSWYSVDDSSFNGYLFEPTASDSSQYTLSPMGMNFANYVSGIAEVAEPYPVRVDVSPGAPLVSSGNVTFTLTALVANSGNNASGKTFPVRFFDGDPSAGGEADRRRSDSHIGRLWR